MNITKNVLIYITFFKILYKIKFKDFLINIIFNNDFVIINFLKIRETIWNNTFNFIKLIEIKIIIKYEIKYRILNLKKNDLKLNKIKKLDYYILKKNYLLKKSGFIRFWKKINNFIYKSKLSWNLF